MIAIRFQVFFFDPTQNRENQLNAVRPVFTSPSAISTLLKTTKFEGKDAVVFSGEAEGIEQLLKQAQRFDTTDWLSFSIDECKAALIKLAKECELQQFDISEFAKEDSQVFGDEILSKAGVYPPDLPAENKWLWDEVGKRFRNEIKRAQPDDDRMEAAHRLIYMKAALKKSMIPFSQITTTQVSKKRDDIVEDIISGEKKADEYLEKWERYLVSDGTFKRVKAIKYGGSSYEEQGSKYTMTHVVEWTLAKDWKVLFEYLKKWQPFHVLSNTKLVMSVNKATEIVIFKDDEASNRAFAQVVHFLTPAQASLLTCQETQVNVLKILNKYAKEWYAKGKFPNIYKFDKERK